jgi:hypothetical protein
MGGKLGTSFARTGHELTLSDTRSEKKLLGGCPPVPQC